MVAVSETKTAPEVSAEDQERSGAKQGARSAKQAERSESANAAQEVRTEAQAQPERKQKVEADAATTSASSKEAGLRTCVGCRKKQPQEGLLRIVLDPDGVTPRVDYLGRLPGRGAYSCPTMKCLELSVQRGGLRKAFKAQVKGSADVLMQEAWSASRRQLRSLLSLANRASKALPGHTRVEWGLRNEEGVLLLLAQDASPSLQRKFRRWATELGIPVYEALSKEEIGPTMGASETAVTLISDTGFAAKIIQELERSKNLLLIQDEEGPAFVK